MPWRALDEQNLPSIAYGIGVHSGRVVAAHVGQEHLQYAVVGDTVNVGSRLCSEAGAGEVVYSRTCAELAGADPVGIDLGVLSLKGVDGGMAAWRSRSEHGAITRSSTTAGGYGSERR